MYKTMFSISAHRPGNDTMVSVYTSYEVGLDWLHVTHSSLSFWWPWFTCKASTSTFRRSSEIPFWVRLQNVREQRNSSRNVHDCICCSTGHQKDQKLINDSLQSYPAFICTFSWSCDPALVIHAPMHANVYIFLLEALPHILAQACIGMTLHSVYTC